MIVTIIKMHTKSDHDGLSARGTAKEIVDFNCIPLLIVYNADTGHSTPVSIIEVQVLSKECRKSPVKYMKTQFPL